MNVEVASKPLSWGALDLSLFGISNDWHKQSIDPPIAFGFAVDQKHLWFVACHQAPATLHPTARPGEFQSELWRYDVAEFFLLDPSTQRYLEFNLSPNSAWWSAEFSGPREQVDATPFPGVATFADMSPDGSWMCAAALPLEKLKEKFNFGAETKLNATFIINSPEQRFLSATPLPGDEPDFHQPDHFKKINFFHNDQS